MEAGPTGVEAGVVDGAGELLSERPLHIDAGAEPLQLVTQSSVRTFPIVTNRLRGNIGILPALFVYVLPKTYRNTAENIPVWPLNLLDITSNNITGRISFRFIT